METEQWPLLLSGACVGAVGAVVVVDVRVEVGG